jgi:hypothetical protein
MLFALKGLRVLKLIVRKLMMAMCKMLLPTEDSDPRSMVVHVEDAGYTSSDTFS